MPPVLYQYWRSSASWRARWALAIKGVEVEIVSVDLHSGENRSAAHLARSPLGRVPALHIDGHTLSESVAIIEYLDETRPEPPLFPREPWLRARTRQVVELINAGVQPLQNLSVLARLSPDPQVQAAWVQHFAGNGLRAVEQVLAEIAAESGVDGPFCVGESLTAADLFLVPQVAHSRRMGVDLAPLTRVLRAEAAALSAPGALALRPEHQPGAPA